MESRVFFINYLWDITPQPEYFPFSEQPIVGNMGFLASRDPVAIDTVALKLIREAADRGEALEALDFERVLETAETMGIGSTRPTVKRIS